LKTHWLIKENRSALILFFSGWASDYGYFCPIKSEKYDILFLYDYSSAEINLSEIVCNYQKIIVIGWSFGVCVANMVCQTIRKNISIAIAINGTLQPIDNEHGIPLSIFDATLENISETGMKKFFRRMCGSSPLLIKFNQFVSQRSTESYRNELTYLRTYCKTTENTANIYNFALVSDSDNIIPPKNQENFWNSQRVTLSHHTEGHFPFYSFDTWEMIIDFCTNK